VEKLRLSIIGVFVSVMVAAVISFALPSGMAKDSGQELFQKPAWKTWNVNALHFSICLPKKFKRQASTDPDFLIFKRSAAPSTVIGILRYDESFGQLSKGDVESIVDDIYDDLYLWSDITYYKIYEPSPIANMAGQHGHQWMFEEFGPGLKDYYWLYELFFDAEGYLYTIISLSSLDKSPVVGTGVTFTMHNGAMRSMRKPLNAGHAAPSAHMIADETRKLRENMLKALNSRRSN